MMPFDIQRFPSCEHLDTIHHVEFDFYGKRVATVSSDKVVCIWDKASNGSGWVKTAWWKKHGGAVWKLDATDSSEHISQTGVHIGRTDSSNGWVRRAVLSESSASITDIQFCPHYLGLRLAGCTSSGKIIVWEAEDIMDLENWNMTFSFEVNDSSYRLSSLTWSTNRFNMPLIIASSDDADAAPTAKVSVVKFYNNMSAYKVTKDKFEFEEQVNFVSFGPSIGLTYHKLAIAVGPAIYIYNLQVQNEDNESSSSRNNHATDQEFSTKTFVKLENGNSQAVRLSWNILGDVISAVHADGTVRLWKYAFSNKWVLVSVINPPEEVDKGKDDSGNEEA
uniref:Nucleoporin SEH1 n=1 Tax=Ditylenchus dipsaci TaxID=166011 RepID=A0A915CZG1_9BILA